MDSTERIPLIRKIKSEDFEEVSRIYSAVTRQAEGADFAELIKAHAQSNDSGSLVAELDGRAVGFLISYILVLGFGTGKSAWIASMGEDPGHTGQGIGARLAAEILRFYETQGISRVYTSLKWEDADLISFFRTLDFKRSDFINLTKELG